MAYDNILEWRDICLEEISHINEKHQKGVETLNKLGIPTINSEDFKKYANALEEYANALEETETKIYEEKYDKCFKNVQTFISGVWQSYKKLKQNHDKKVDDYIKTINNVTVGTQSSMEINKWEEEKKKYGEYLTKDEKKLKKEFSEIKPILAKNGVTMISTLENLIYVKTSNIQDENEKNTKKKLGFINSYNKLLSTIDECKDKKLLNSKVLKIGRDFFSGAYNSAFGRIIKFSIKNLESFSLTYLTKKVNELKSKVLYGDFDHIIGNLSYFITTSIDKIKKEIYPYYNTLLTNMVDTAVDNVKTGQLPLSKYKFRIIIGHIQKKQNAILKEMAKDCYLYGKYIEFYDRDDKKTFKKLMGTMEKFILIKILSEYNIPEVSPLSETVLKGTRFGALIGGTTPAILGAWIGLTVNVTFFGLALSPAYTFALISCFVIPLSAVCAGVLASVGAFFGVIWNKIYSKNTIKNFEKKHEELKNSNHENIGIETPT